MMARQSGYYWVMQGGAWYVALYLKHAGAWLFCGDGCDYLECQLEEELDQINETRILAPDEVSDE